MLAVMNARPGDEVVGLGKAVFPLHCSSVNSSKVVGKDTLFSSSACVSTFKQTYP